MSHRPHKLTLFVVIGHADSVSRTIAWADAGMLPLNMRQCNLSGTHLPTIPDRNART